MDTIPRMSRRRQGFSLTEVVVALGVVAVGVVAVLGVLPSGWAACRDSTSETQATQIAQTVMATLRGQTQGQGSDVRLFDYQVNLLAEGVLDLFTEGTGDDWNDVAENSRRFWVQVRWRDAALAGISGFDPGEGCAVAVEVRWPPWELPRPSFVNLLRTPHDEGAVLP